MKPGLAAAVVAIMAALFFVDTFLAKVERNETLSEAQSLAAQGERLLSAGRASAAVPPLQRAHAMVRDNPRYQLALAKAQLESGRTADAELHLRGLLEKDSNDGETNLVMARLQVRLGNSDEATAYYHRAIYGTWTDPKRAQSVRRELVDFLAKEDRHKQLLSELLLLQDGSRQTPEEQLRMAHLFLVAGSPARAAEMYRSSIHQQPDNADAYIGLAETQLASGDFSAAHSSLRQASRRRPDDPAIEQKLALATELSSLDPTLRRLSSTEKYDRSLRFLDLIRQDLTQCAESLHKTLPPSPAPVIQRPKVINNEASEQLLTNAEQLWNTRVALCGPATSPDNPLPALLHKISQ